jgi:hypothetical protein
MMPAVTPHASGWRPAILAPLGLLLGYAGLFAGAALGRSPIAFDDHPGQLYRLWLVTTTGVAPWTWSWGWWTGYPELQFYPPAFAYLGALVHAATLGTLGVPATYQALVWVAHAAPGVSAYVLLARTLGSGWLALPGAFVALTLSLWPTLMSGVEGGVHVGMVPARLGWALLPLLAGALARWTAGGSFPARSVVPLVAAVALTHPAHLPAAMVLVGLAALAAPDRRQRAATALGWLALAALVTAFWTLPLLARLPDTRALAWGELTPSTLRDTIIDHPLSLALLALAVPAAVLARSLAERIVAIWPWAMAVVVLLDAAVIERLGLRWLPAHRVLDGFWLALVLAAGLGGGRLLACFAAGSRLREAVAALASVAALVAISLAGHDTLTLWPRPGTWPSYATLDRGLRLPSLWDALRAGPPGRVLFVRSAVPLVFGPQWWRPHSHVTALAPLRAGRAIVNGTFTHPSPVAALLYRGDAGRAPIRELVERLDGRTLFGRPLESLDAATLDAYTRRLRVSIVVALDEDLPRLNALADNPRFPTRRDEPPFVIWLGAPAALPEPLSTGGWKVSIDPPGGGWASTGVAYYPLWRVSTAGSRVETRRGTLNDLEVRAPAGVTAVELTYSGGAVEWAGVALSGIGVLVWLGLGWRRLSPA